MAPSISDDEESLSFFGLNSDIFSSTAGPSTAVASISAPSGSASTNNYKKCKYNPHKAKSTWEHFHHAQGKEPDRATDSQCLWYCQRYINPTWSTQVSRNARKHLATAHNIIVEQEPSKGKKARHEELRD